MKTYHSFRQWQREMEDHAMLMPKRDKDALELVYFIRGEDGQPLVMRNFDVDVVHIATQDGTRTFRFREGVYQVVVVPFDADVRIEQEEEDE